MGTGCASPRPTRRPTGRSTGGTAGGTGAVHGARTGDDGTYLAHEHAYDATPRDATTISEHDDERGGATVLLACGDGGNAYDVKVT